ncbi:MAG: hypothetical protein COU27_01905 [Candidatus Levybacteria bacterium CG10_big_fil_rev_8_21_14_0_10_36_7]|nr:MAG: hypothetical protein COU27_01905 [Candidatus Levybacteria bacterium CG10_big_fil_rev_8_21_14_0_10_36_7]
MDKHVQTKKNLENISKKIDSVIKKLLVSCLEKRHHPLILHQMLSGGKRLRPAMSVIVCKMMGGEDKDVLYSAAGLEILHNYTLIIDDIIDHSSTRRGLPTVWSKFGTSIAQSLEMAYSGALLEAGAKSKYSSEVSFLYAKALKTVGDGEILDILFEQSGREDEPYIVKNRFQAVNKSDYLKMISKKTAILFETACEVGGICAEAEPKEIFHLKKFGFNVGLAFQIQDDILDIFGEQKTLGKKIGGDIIEHKLGNIVISLFFKKANPKQRDSLMRILKKNKINDKDIERSIKLIGQTQAKSEAEKMSKEFTKKSKQHLSFLPKNVWNLQLEALADFIINRES